MLKLVYLVDPRSKDTIAFTKKNNTRDIFLNVAFKDKRYETPDEVCNSISHEVIHNVLAKLEDDKTSQAFDNLYSDKMQDKLYKKFKRYK